MKDGPARKTPGRFLWWAPKLSGIAAGPSGSRKTLL